jgi:4-amino-4-deoxy-L-arabinose transferase-like glycosyltransferase
MDVTATGQSHLRVPRWRDLRALINRLPVWAIAYQTALSRVAGWLALEMVVIAAVFFAVAKEAGLNYGIVFAIGGGMSLGAFILISGADGVARERLHDKPRNLTKIVTRTRWIPLILGAFWLALTAEINGDVFDPAFIKHIDYNSQFIILIAGISLLTFGAAGRRLTTDAVANESTSHNWMREVLPLALIVLLAFAVRVYRLNDLPRFFVDEVHFSNPLTHFYMAKDIELLLPFSSVAAFPYIYPYMQWLFVDVIGRNLAGLRALSVMFGVLNIIAVYLLARELFNRRIALLSAALLAFFPPHIQFSRIGLNNIADPFFGVMALYFIARGLNRRETMRGNFAAAGAMIGLTQYFYEGGRLLYPLLALAWLLVIGVAHYLAISWRMVEDSRNERDPFQRIQSLDLGHLRKSVAAFCVVALLVGAPIYYTLMGQHRDLAVRMETAGLAEKTTQTLDDFEDVLRHFSLRFRQMALIHLSVGEYGLYYGGEEGLLLGFVIPFFLLGTAYAVWRSDQRATLLLLMWMGATWIGNAFLEDSRISARFVVAFPAMAILVALGLDVFGRIVLANAGKSRNRLLAGMMSALIVLQIAYYFGPHTTAYNRQFLAAIEHDTYDVLYRSLDFPPDTQIHMIADPVMSDRDATDVLRYLAKKPAFINTLLPEELTETYLQMQVVNRPHAFFVAADEPEAIERITTMFPTIEGPYYSDVDIPHDQQFALYFLPVRMTFPTGSPR